jgi:hypothetical protein
LLTRTARDLEKELTKIKFLEQVKECALTHKNDAVPYDRSELMQAKMFVLGLIDALYSEGYRITKND